MQKKLRMGQLLDGIWILIVVLFMCGFMFYKMGPGLIDLMKGPTALTEEMQLEDMEGEYVTWTVNYPIDEYMETTKTTKVNGVSTGTKKERSSWLVIDDDRGVCLSIEVPAKRYDEMDDQADLFYRALEEETDIPDGGVTISGTLEILEGEPLRYFRQLEDYIGLTAEDVVYHIGDDVIRGEKKTNILGMSAIGTFLLLIVIFIVVKTLRNSPKKLLGQYLEKNPDVTMEQLENDFSTATEVNKVWIGRKWTFSPKLKDLLFDNSQVIWVYSRSVRSGRNVNFYVWWIMIDGSEKTVSLSSEKKCTEVVEKYKQFSHIVVGDNPEYGYLLKNDKEAFLNMKYRAAQGDETNL